MVEVGEISVKVEIDHTWEIQVRETDHFIDRLYYTQNFSYRHKQGNN